MSQNGNKKPEYGKSKKREGTKTTPFCQDKKKINEIRYGNKQETVWNKRAKKDKNILLQIKIVLKKEKNYTQTAFLILRSEITGKID